MRPELGMALRLCRTSIRAVVILLVFTSLQIEGTTILVEAANSKHVLYQPTCGELGLEETNIKLPFLAVPPSYHQRI